MLIAIGLAGAAIILWAGPGKGRPTRNSGAVPIPVRVKDKPPNGRRGGPNG